MATADLPRSSILPSSTKDRNSQVEVKANATMRDQYGNLWFGTVKGATCNYVELEKEGSKEPVTHITEMRVNLEPRDMVSDLTLGMAANQLNVIIKFKTHSLTNQGKSIT